MRWISKLIDSVTERGREIWQQENPDTTAGIRPIDEDCADLLSRKGDAVAMAIARQVLHRYQNMSDDGKSAFFTFLLSLGPDYERVSDLSRQLSQEENPKLYAELVQSFNKGRRTLFELLNIPGEGTRALIDMRTDLLRLMRGNNSLKTIDLDLQSTLESWFNRGFLEFRTIDWHTPADILEKLIQYEAVHEISDWTDLKRRLAADRDCFAFFHPSLPDEPLIFVQVAYTNEISRTIDPFLDKTFPISKRSSAQAAIFYSISNCQSGLKGISFGNFLIKQVVQHIQSKHSNIRFFSTLSPMPGLNNAIRSGALTEDELTRLAESSALKLKQLASDEQLSTLLTTEHDRLDKLDDDVKTWLEKVGVHYLTRTRRGEMPYDPVARFHLSNGASIYRVNPFSNTKDYGMQSSAGLMVNYLYDLARVELNHEQFKQNGTIDIQKPAKKITRTLRGVA